MKFDDKVEYFMYVYMFEIEKLLNDKTKELLGISYQMDEANTDRPLKEFIKNEIIENINDLSSCKETNVIIQMENGSKKSIKIEDLNNIYIKNVYLPDELNDDIKSRIYPNKTGVYTDPDLCIELTDNKNTVYETIELKTTKNDAIPGSSIQQITPNEWTIFVKHDSENVEVATGKYLFALNSKVQFPDRSPRPQVSYSEIKKWNKNFRDIKNDDIVYFYDNEVKMREQWISDWKVTLAKTWVDILFGQVRDNKAWFNDCLKIFAKELLEKYESCSEEERKIFIDKIKKVE